MNSYIVLTAIGSDRPGLVDEISAFLSMRNINIEDSRMAVLGGEFAVIMLISGGENVIDKIPNEIAELEISTGLGIQTKRTVAPGARKVGPSLLHKLTTTSMDHPGIVHQITNLLRKHSINIESLETYVSNAPLSGAPIFNMNGILNIPSDVKISKLRKELEDLGDRLNVDIYLEAVR
jgi:glycine cleavage system transcriptional repressor